MFNKQAPEQAPEPTPDNAALLERLAVLEAAVLKPEATLPRVLTEGSTFAARKAVARPKPPPRRASLGVATENVESIRRGKVVRRTIELEHFVEVGHGARMFAREVGDEQMHVVRG